MPSHKPLKMKIRLPIRVQPEIMPPPGETGVYTNKIHYLRKYLLDELVSKKFAMDFMEPVDTAALQVPDYYAIIRRPMDVGTIIKRVQNRYYHCVEELILDFKLVISNCYTFNRPGDVVYRNCQKLERFFHRVLNKMPRGEEKPSTKDPRAPGKQSFEKTCEAVQRQCREQMRKLQMSIAREEDKSICKYFNAKWDMLSQKIDKYYFKTVEEFRFEVNNIFKIFDSQVKTFYEFYHRICENGSFPIYDNCIMYRNQPGLREPEPRCHLEDQDVSDMLYTLKKAESGVEHCVKSYSREKEQRARELIEILAETVSDLKLKMNDEYQEMSDSIDEKIDGDNCGNKKMDMTHIYAQQSSEEEDEEEQDDEYESEKYKDDDQEHDTESDSSHCTSPDLKKARIDLANNFNASSSYTETKPNAYESTLWADLKLTSSEESEGEDEGDESD